MKLNSAIASLIYASTLDRGGFRLVFVGACGALLAVTGSFRLGKGFPSVEPDQSTHVVCQINHIDL
jgi:hypothetical protein